MNLRIGALCCSLLMGFAAQAADSARPVLGVIKFQDETGAMFLQGGVGRSLTQMLTNELAARATFTVVERQKLRDVLEEQNLGESGRITPGQGAAIGRLTGAQFLVTGTVTAFEEDAQTRYKGGLFGRGKVERVSQGGYLALDLRVIDTTSGEIQYARTIEGRTEGSVTVAAADSRDIVTDASQGPGSKAVRAAVIEIIDYLECAIVVRDACLADFERKERERIERTRKAASFR
jgi:curli biogenesis system outer membrane secretion channel CsgG